MKYFTLLLLSILSLCANAQTKENTIKKSIQGTVFDSASKEPVSFASVRLLTQTDSTYVQGITTDEKGKFKITIAKQGKYILDISFIGYKSFLQNINTNDEKTNYNLGDIYLEEKTIELGAAVVEAKVPDVRVKGDTIEYNAGAYKTEEHELLQDLIRKIPGIEIDSEGNIKANGKPIQKILVDGKEFFGNDIMFALNNLPANMIKSLQLFKEQSEDAKATGVKDQDPPQVLNLTVKEEFKKSIFGNVKAGYGSDDRYQGNFNANRMYGENQYSILGNAGNVNGDGRGMYVGGGENTNKNTGVNMNINPSKKIEINGSVDYSYSKNFSENRSESYTSLLDRYTQGNSTYTNSGNNADGRFNMNWKPDSLTTIFIRTGFGINDSSRGSYSSDSSHTAQQNPTIGFSSSSGTDKGVNMNNSLMVTRKLGSKGRSVRFNLNNSIRDNDSDGKNYSKTIYPDATPDRIIDNISTANSKSTGYGVTLGYVEPLGKGKLLQMEYSFRSSNSKRDNDARRMDDMGNYTIIDSTYTRFSEMQYNIHNINLRYQLTKEKFNYSIGFNIDPTHSDNKVTLGDSVIEHITQNTINFSPSINFNYRPNDATNWTFNYSGNTRQPDSRQLSGDTIIHNSLSKSVGNPDLRTSYNNRVSAYFMKSNFETGRYFNLSLNFDYTFNDIVDYTITDERGNRFNTYRNVDGNMNAYIYASYNTPLKNKKFQISFDPNIYYNKRIGFTNEEKSVIQNISIAPSVYLRFNSDKVETNLRVNVSQNISFNNLSETKRSSNTRYGFYQGTKVKLPYDFSIRNDISWTLLSGYGEGSKNSELLWNASIEKLVLKKKATVQLQLVDILNDRNIEMRMINGNDYSYSTSNYIARYFLLSFSYRFHIKKGSSNNNEDPYGNDYYYY